MIEFTPYSWQLCSAITDNGTWCFTDRNQSNTVSSRELIQQMWDVALTNWKCCISLSGEFTPFIRRGICPGVRNAGVCLDGAPGDPSSPELIIVGQRHRFQCRCPVWISVKYAAECFVCSVWDIHFDLHGNRFKCKIERIGSYDWQWNSALAANHTPNSSL